MVHNNFRVQYVVFTSFRTEDETCRALNRCTADWYLFGREICPKTGKAHLQGMAYSKKRRSWKDLQSICHVEKCHCPAESLTYCSKDGDIFELGQRPNMGLKVAKLSAKQLIEMEEDEAVGLGPNLYIQRSKCKEIY